MFGRDSMLVVDSQRFFTDPEPVYDDVLGFLGLKSPARGKAVTGLITSGAALLLGVIGVILTILGIALIGAAAANTPGVNNPNNPPFNQPNRPIGPNPRR